MNFKRAVLIIQALCFSILYSEQSTDSSSVLILNNADFNRNTLVDGKLISILEGNVEFDYNNVIINADKSVWYRGSGEVNFTGHVHVKMEDQTLTCDRIDFFREDKKLIARGNINFFNHKEQVRIVGWKGVYLLDSKHLTLTGHPKLYRYNNSVPDTLSIHSEIMIYSDSLNTAIAIENVEIYKGALTAQCSTATYNMKTGITKLRINPQIYYDIHELTGDSIDLFFVDEILQGISVMRNANGKHLEVASFDTTFTKVKGDSIYMQISDSGEIEKIWTYDHANILYYSSNNPESVNEASGKVMVLTFTEGKTGDVTITGNADCLYHIDDENNSGKNEASGDSLTIYFNEGKAVFVKMNGAVRGVYSAVTTK